MYITNEAVGRVGYYQLISGKSEKNNCFSKFSCNSLDFFGWNLLKSWLFLYRRRGEKNFSDLQNFSTRNSPSIFPYLVKLNDNGSYHGLTEPIRKLENHYPELKIYYYLLLYVNDPVNIIFMRHLGSHFSEIKERNYSHDGGPDIPLGI